MFHGGTAQYDGGIRGTGGRQEGRDHLKGLAEASKEKTQRFNGQWAAVVCACVYVCVIGWSEL